MYEEKIYISSIYGDLSHSLNIELEKFDRHLIGLLNLSLKNKGDDTFQLFFYEKFDILKTRNIKNRPVTLRLLIDFLAPNTKIF